MAVEEEGLRVFQSVRIKIGEDRGGVGSSPDPCSWYPARLDQLLVLPRPDGPVLRGTAGEAGPAPGGRLFVCVSARGCLRVSVCAGPFPDRSGSRAPEFTCTSTRGTVPVLPLQGSGLLMLVSGCPLPSCAQELPSQGGGAPSPFLLCGAAAAGFEAGRARLCVCALQAW